VSEPVLVTGATGTTGSRVVHRLRQRGATVRATSRSDPGMTHFDWHERATWAPTLDGVRAVYLIGPTDGSDPAPLVHDFLQDGAALGLRRVVLLSASALVPAPAGPGALPGLVRSAVPEWTILRPSWFMSNVLGDTPLAAGLRAGQVRTATGDGKVAFVDPDDIAAVAVEALLTPTPLNAELVLTGPAAHSYDELCTLVARLAGRTIQHASLSVEQYTAHLIGNGVPVAYAPLLAGLDEPISRGSEDRVTDTVERISGSPAGSLQRFLEQHAAEIAR
jgi:uncharacterized protein YbjT (DUF2867 family)